MHSCWSIVFLCCLFDFIYLSMFTFLFEKKIKKNKKEKGKAPRTRPKPSQHRAWFPLRSAQPAPWPKPSNQADPRAPHFPFPLSLRLTAGARMAATPSSPSSRRHRAGHLDGNRSRTRCDFLVQAQNRALYKLLAPSRTHFFDLRASKKP